MGTGVEKLAQRVQSLRRQLMDQEINVIQWAIFDCRRQGFQFPSIFLPLLIA